MSFINLNITKTDEPRAMSEGHYELEILGIPSTNPSKAGKPMITCKLGFRDHPEALPFYHRIVLPDGEDEPRTAEFKSLMLRRFLEQFSIPYNETGFNVEDFNGAHARGFVALGEPDNSGTRWNELRVDRMARK